ncbi:hypothetical protein NQ317_006567 [Molorchus minor]|uniref:Uncharacterized protein n=1 Tax=Molorchus minor TaxID=1323400 RepID=A0ABQ9K2J1_9CUCU|nr:hypothetical protein NQ317_006567 [Molorchus minor]
MPSDRNVLLSMNEYVLSEINPAHPNNINSPTHVILFCIRFITEEIFQPIGGLLIYKNEDQGALLAECVKAYINDLWKMGLCVVGTISPPLEIFRTIMGRLLNIVEDPECQWCLEDEEISSHVLTECPASARVRERHFGRSALNPENVESIQPMKLCTFAKEVENMNTYSDVIIYSVAPFKEIVHIYDTRFLLIKFQNVFKEGGIRFTEGKREFFASWDDMEPVMNIKSKGNTLSNYVTVNYNIHGKAEIFTKDIFENFLEVEAEGVLSEHAGGCAVLLNSIRNFIQYIELESINLKAMHDIDCYDNLVDILQGMTFQQNKKLTCTKEDPTIVNRLINPTTRRKLDFVSVNRDCLVQGYSVKEINNFEYVEYTDVILNKKKHQHSKGSIEIKQEIGNAKPDNLDSLANFFFSKC